MYKCEDCKLEFESFQAKANHIRWHHTDNTEYYKKSSAAAILANEKVYGKWLEEETKCSNSGCDNIVSIKYREGKKKEKYFCSRSCANSRGKRSLETKNKIRLGVKTAWKNEVYDNESYYKKISKNKYFSSKKEREISAFFKEKYPNYEWKTGGRLIFEETSLTRDLYSNKLKVCFEFDGIWHFKDIHNQLKEKQLKDKLLEKWCGENNYRLIRIDELEYETPEQIEELIFKRNDPIIKIGKRY